MKCNSISIANHYITNCVCKLGENGNKFLPFILRKKQKK